MPIPKKLSSKIEEFVKLAQGMTDEEVATAMYIVGNGKPVGHPIRKLIPESKDIMEKK